MIFNRRKLIQIAALGSVAYITQACSKKADQNPNVSGELGNDQSATNAAAPSATENKALNLISESDATASALGYKHDAAAVPAGLKTEKNGTPGDKQHCSNCVFYTAMDSVDGGKCALLPSGYVKPKGWCQSWSLKPA